jgi:hypothetical protein
MRLAPKALYHDSLGHRPRNPITQAKQALKARFCRRVRQCQNENNDRNESRFQRLCLLGDVNPGAMPQAQGERRAFGAKAAH